MERAHEAGDRQLLKAGAAHAFARSSSDLSGHFAALVDAYAEETAVGHDLEEIRGLIANLVTPTNLNEQLATTPPSPPEVRDRRVLEPDRAAPLSKTVGAHAW